MTYAYLVWSNQHRAWWRPNSAGYTRDVRAAGWYARDEAIDIAGQSRDGWGDPSKPPDELAIAISDLPKNILAAVLAAQSADAVGGSKQP